MIVGNAVTIVRLCTKEKMSCKWVLELLSFQSLQVTTWTPEGREETYINSHVP
jgi:hypothetical protein